MEAAALYANAAQAGKKALSLFTVSNNILDGSEMDPKLRETSLVDMTIIALRTANE
jgi:purine-nucleoside phosphorylase